MVFESLVSDLLNRFIGDYVENLDKSQLKIGIWGNVVLENLKVKENALSEFDVPFKVKAGQIKLTLKIPWKNLYNDAVVATLDGLYLLVVPGAIKYDAAKEERYQQEAKQRELQRIEEALQMAAQRKPQEEKKDTFVEKLATQVIKNLQVKISSIHLRYEDDLLDPHRPLSMGVTLSELSLQTTDENWKSCILNEAAKIIYKLGRLDCLCAYWNVNSPIFYKGSWEDIVFRPIFASAKMCINPNADLDLKNPKVNLHLEVQNIAIEMTKPQYLSMVELLESIDCMVKNAPYRRFRPEVPVGRNTRVWRYSFNSILEVHIRRYSHMWSWSNIKQHRENLRAYKSAYKSKLLSHSKSSQDTERQIQDLEKVLDVFNITLARQQAHMEVIRSGQKVVGKKAAGGQKQGGGFFSSLFGRKAKKEEQEQEESKDMELDQLMTAEEKEKLYTAIGYSGSSHNLALPRQQYVAVIVTFQLLRTSVTVREQPDVPEILKIQMLDLSTKISQRPGAQAVRVEAVLEHWYVTGLQQQGAVPSLIASVGDSASSLLSVVFELNPEESAADQLLRVHSQPVEIIYDALTVNSMADFFKTGKGVDLEVLTSATLSKLEEIKEKTATLSHIIETRKVLDLRIDLKPSYLLVPKSGFYSDTSDLIIVDFGSFQLHSVEQSGLSVSSSSSSSLEEIMDRAYERYNVELRRVQVLYSKSEDWVSARLQGSSVQHILQPMDFTVHLAKCMVEKDARMPFKVSGELPLLHIKISDQKIQNILELVDSIPLPNMGSSPSTPTKKSDEDTSERSTDEDHQRSALEELTDVHFKFEVREVLLELTRQVDQEKTILSFSIRQLGAEGKRRSFDLSITSYLRKVTLDYCGGDGRNQPLHLIRSSEQQGSNLLKVELIKADPSGPSFQTLFDNTEQTLKVELSSLDFLLHTKALLSTINYLSSALPSQLATMREQDAKKQVEKTGQGRTAKGARDGGIFSFKLFAMLGCFHVEVCDDRCSIADIRVQGIDASVLVQAKETEVFARLRDIVVTDVNPRTVHRKAVSIMGEEVFSFKLSLFPGATEGEGYTDTSKVDGKVTMRLGCIQIVYLHKFLMSLLMFVDNFQTAKEALSAATAQAAEKAASSVRDFAQKSFRLSMDIKLKAPLIIIPQSSTSHNAVVVDLGLIMVGNSFSLLPVEGFSLPAVVEKMDVKLTQLKLSATLKSGSSQPDIEILQPINTELLVTRNLAASWFTKIPGVQVQGVLRSLNMSLGEEDLAVLMKILVENIGEGSKEHSVEVKRQVAQGGLTENTINILLNFEIKEVLLTLKKPIEQKESPFLLFHIAHLGIDTKVRKYDMCATTYINKITMKCLEFNSSGEPLCLISSSVESGAELLKVQYFKVTFTSLDFMLHTEALLSTINFLSAALSSSSMSSVERATKLKTEDKTVSAKSALVSPADSEVIDLKVVVTLGAFNALVCDQSCNMADIKIQGSLLMQGPQMHISARLRDFIVLNVDPRSIHKKAISIVGDEVFSFAMSLTPNATEGAGYDDTSKTDGKVKLNVGCIQVVYLHKFVMSLLNFSSNFQTAKEAVSAATAQAAEKAASSVRDFAQKCFRLSMDIKLKAPLIIIPQSSTSHDALVMDLGLIMVGNSFSLLPVDGCPLPAVIDNMDVQLTQLKLSTCMDLVSDQPHTELLEPVNLHLNIKRNLAASWYKKMAAIEIDGDLKPMKLQVELSQDDLKVLLRILMENLGEAGSLEPTANRQEEADVGKSTVSSDEEADEALESMKFNFSIESLGLVLYSSDPKLPSGLQHQQDLRLGEFTLHLLKTSGRILASGSAEVTTVLTACTLDDLRTGMERVTSMVGRRDEDSLESMIDVTYRQSGGERELVAVLQKLYLCASVEFLMAVADFFLQALPQSTRLRAVVVDPEVVFVASLMKADAPALVASFQCDFTLRAEDDGTQDMRANLRELKVLACPFIRNKVDKAVTTVLRPCSVALETNTHPNRPLSGSVTVEEVIVKLQISPFILNTVMTITAAMTAKQHDKQSQDSKPGVGDLWSVMNIYNCNYWFLGVDPATEVTESFREQDGRNEGESFMKNNPVQDKSPIHGDDFIILPEPRTAMSICSKDTMNITISQSSLTVLYNLTKAFSLGTASTCDSSLKEKAPFTIRNSLGIPLIVQHSANLRPVGTAVQGKLHELLVDQSMDLEHSVFEASSRGKLSALQRQESCLFNLSIPSGYSEISNIAVDKPGRRLYNIRGPMLQEAVSVLLQIDAAEGNKVITIRSPLQIKNHFSVPFTILKYCPTSRSLQSVGQAEPEKEFHVTLETYCQLFVRPAGPLDGQYAPSSTCVAWKEQVHHSSEVRSLLQCPATDSSLLPLMVSTLAVSDDLRHIASHGEEDWDPAYVIHLHPVATLRNLLPYTIRYMMESSADSYELPEGSVSDLLNARISGEIVSLVLMRYQGRDWHGHIRITQEMPEFFTTCLTCDSDTNMTVDVSVHVTRAASRLLLSLFSPYWIINKTSRVLQYRAEDISVKHPADFRDIILFSFRKKTLFSKSKLQLCVSTSSWSDGFSLDTVGSSGCVRCPSKNMDFLVGVSIQISSFNLTRIVTMSPFYTLVNKSSYELEVGEVTSQTSTRWHYISSTECLPLWPENSSGKLCVRVVGSESTSKFFFFNQQDNGTLLSLDMCGGIIVDINISDHSNVISFSDYYEGAAPALLLNHTPWVTISYRQELKPGQARRFAWDDPAGVRTLSWSCMEHSGDLDLLKDEVGQFSYDSLSQVHWVSFLDGRQRVLLFTEDVGVVTKARQAEELEQFQQEVKVSLQNLGLSLINNTSRQEIAYIGITSGVVWEMKPKNRWKPFSQKNINLLEKAYQSQLSGKTEGGWVRLETNLEQVNLSGATMMMRQPFSCQVRRNFLSGIQVEFKQSLHQRSLRAQLHWLQVDNQLPGAIFPIVFHPVPPPKSIALDSPKPFIDVSIITRFNQHSSVMQFYFMALVQEMAVKLDQGFLGAILALLTPAADPQADRQKSRLIERDLQLLQAELMEASLTDSSGLSFFEHFHISPIKLHLSLSLGSSGEDSAQEVAAVQSLNLLLKSIGATLTDVDDLIFRLAFFEVKYQFYRREKLVRAVVRHYSEQFLRQMYVLVLGLDVLGNPFGLIRGLSEGVEAFFYEPFQGAVQGPEEFAEGFVIGVRSLLGHTVGAAGMVSRITGSVGKGLAAITMDKEYQQKRREEMNRPPRDFGESLAKGGKGLLKGVVGGVTGIVTKPVEAKREGAAGFFKGIGKGLVGVVARPTGGIVDMASSTFQGIQVAESTEEVTKLRPVRLIREDGVIRPYDLTESQGFELFQRSEIKQLDGEVFRDHCQYPGHRKTTIIITNRVVCVKEIDFVGHFNKEWECLFENFYRPPTVTGSELKIYCKALQAAISDAQVAQQQHRMARQKSQRFMKFNNKQ
uniref:Vacuolar protein sorting 13 homolog C n=1 Tax=Seriola dumerili TaxID=41447 RepID=A0A3B4TYL0_SERDU